MMLADLGADVVGADRPGTTALPVPMPLEADLLSRGRPSVANVEHHGVVQPAPAPRFLRTPGALSTPPPLRAGADTRAAPEAWGIADSDALLASEGAVQA